MIFNGRKGTVNFWIKNLFSEAVNVLITQHLLPTEVLIEGACVNPYLKDHLALLYNYSDKKMQEAPRLNLLLDVQPSPAVALSIIFIIRNTFDYICAPKLHIMKVIMNIDLVNIWRIFHLDGH